MQALGDPQRRACGTARIRADKLTTEFEREERISRRALFDSRELGRRELEPKPLLEEPVQNADLEGAERDRCQPIGCKRVVELKRGRCLSSRAHGDQHADGLLAQPSEGDLEHRSRCTVEPLRIVESNEHRPARGKCAEHVQDSEADRVHIDGLRTRLDEKKRNFERSATRRRKGRRHLLEHRQDQLREAGERERGFRLDPATHQDAVEAVSRCGNPCFPERGLPDPGLTREDESPRTLARPRRGTSRSRHVRARAQ